MAAQLTLEMKKKLDAFLDKHAQLLLDWLNLLKDQRDKHCWRPNNANDLFALSRYEESCKADQKLSQFEKATDKNILLTYLKYIGVRTPKDGIWPFTFNYEEPKIDLVLNPQE